MSKLAHHHSLSSTIGKVHEWGGRIMIVVAIVGGAVVLIGALTNHGYVTW